MTIKDEVERGLGLKMSANLLIVYSELNQFCVSKVGKNFTVSVLGGNVIRVEHKELFCLAVWSSGSKLYFKYGKGKLIRDNRDVVIRAIINYLIEVCKNETRNTSLA